VIFNEHCITESSGARNAKTANRRASELPFLAILVLPRCGQQDKFLVIIIVVEEFFDVEGVDAV
jgi:hypothetical protein